MRESVTYQAILEEGAVKGREEGREEGRLDEARRILLRQATRRFGPPAETARVRVETSTDPAKLEAALDRMLDATGWDDLISSLT